MWPVPLVPVKSMVAELKQHVNFTQTTVSHYKVAS